MPTETTVDATDPTIPGPVPTSPAFDYYRSAALSGGDLDIPGVPGAYIGYRYYSNGTKTFVEWGIWAPETSASGLADPHDLTLRYIDHTAGDVLLEVAVLDTASGDSFGYAGFANRVTDATGGMPADWVWYYIAGAQSVRARWNAAGTAVEAEFGEPVAWWWDPDIGAMHVGYVAMGAA